jgi:riboflavin kinase/FMN adenylyltransferase
MQIITRLEALADRPRALAIGTFDGVHIGHRATVDRARDRARERGLTSTVLTFDRHPRAVVDPSRAPALLTPLDERIRLLGELEPDELVLLAFDAGMAAMSAAQFCVDLLARTLQARFVVVGQNFNFGAGGIGDAALLTECGAAHGFETEVLGLKMVGDKIISSTSIRELIRIGAVEEARELLGRPPSISGHVGRGHGRGRTLGIPTANVVVEPHSIKPARGVYAARALVEGRWHRAAVNVGQNPTFQNGSGSPTDAVEVFLLAFAQDIYAQPIRVDLLRRIRDERRFDDARTLVAQMRNDIAVVAALEDGAFADVGLCDANIS